MKKFWWMLLLAPGLIVGGCGDDKKNDPNDDIDYTVTGVVDRPRGAAVSSAYIVLIKEMTPQQRQFLDGGSAVVKVNGIALADTTFELPIPHSAFVGSNIPTLAGATVHIEVDSPEYGNYDQDLRMPGGSFRILSPAQGAEVKGGDLVNVRWSGADKVSGYYISMVNYTTGFYHFEYVETTNADVTGPVLYDSQLSGVVASAVRVSAFSGEHFDLSPPSFSLGLQCATTDEVVVYVKQ